MDSSREEINGHKKPKDKSKKIKEKITISRRNSIKSARGNWTLWMSYKYPDPMPIVSNIPSRDRINYTIISDF
jgi:hypothetical protein